MSDDYARENDLEDQIGDLKILIEVLEKELAQMRKPQLVEVFALTGEKMHSSFFVHGRGLVYKVHPETGGFTFGQLCIDHPPVR